MRRTMIAIATGAALVATGPASAHGSHGGGSRTTTTYVFVYSNRYGPYIPPLKGPVLTLPGVQFEVTEAAPQAVEGAMKPGDVIARHGLRVADARVLVDPVNGPPGAMVAGTVLSKVTAADGKRVLWCDLHGKHAGFGQIRRFDCLSDEHGTGRFDRRWTAISDNGLLGLATSVAHSPTDLGVPASFREAQPGERPLATLGYQWCDGDGVASPPRFALAVALAGDEGWINGEKSAGCAFGIWRTPADHSRVDIDGRVLTFGPVAKSGGVHYAYAGRISAAVIAPLTAGGSLPSAGQVAPAPAPVAAPTEPLVADGAPSATGGVLEKGQGFFSIGVRHGLTGVLMNEVRGRGWLADRPLSVDQPVYGVPMAGSSGQTIIWCAPRLDNPADHAAVKHYVGICLPDGWWVKTDNAMMTVNLSWPAGGGQLVSTPTVDRRPVDLPPISMSYAFGGWTKEGWLIVDVRLNWGEGPKTLRSIIMPPGADGVSTLRVMGGEIAVKRGGPKPPESDRAIVEVRAPPQAGGRLVY